MLLTVASVIVFAKQVKVSGEPCAPPPLPRVRALLFASCLSGPGEFHSLELKRSDQNSPREPSALFTNDSTLVRRIPLHPKPESGDDWLELLFFPAACLLDLERGKVGSWVVGVNEMIMTSLKL